MSEAIDLELSKKSQSNEQEISSNFCMKKYSGTENSKNNCNIGHDPASMIIRMINHLNFIKIFLQIYWGGYCERNITLSKS